MTDPQDLIKSATTIHEAATPGPWGPIDDCDGVAAMWDWRGMSCPSGQGGHGGDGLVFATHEWDVGLRKEDIEFIAAARTLVPELSAALEQVTLERDEARAGVAELRKTMATVHAQIRDMSTMLRKRRA